MMDTQFANMISLRSFLTFYYKNRRRLQLAFWLPFITIVALSFLITPRYKASSVLTVRMGSEYVYQPETGSGQNTPEANIPFDHDQIFKSEVAILGSDDLHKAVIQQIGLDKLYPGLLEGVTDDAGRAQALAKGLMKFDKRLDVNLEKESSVITVSFEDPNSETAVQVVDVLLNLYMEKRKDLYLEPRVQMAKDHAEEAHQRVIAAEDALEKFKLTHKILSYDEERQELIQGRSDIQNQLATVTSPGLQEKMAYYEDKLTALNRDQAQFNALSNDETVANEEYAAFAHRLGEATAYEDLERERESSVRVIQPPSVPADAKNLQPFMIIGGFVLSLLLAFVIGFLTDAFSTVFSTPEQLARSIGLPVLVTLRRHK